MKYQAIKKVFETTLKDFFAETGFKLVAFDAFSFTIVLQSNCSYLRIYFAKIKSLKGICYSGGGLEIIFTDIEALINELINKHELWVGKKSGPVTDLNTTFRDKDSNEPYQINWRKRLAACEIATEEDVKEFCYLLQHYIREYVINWFKEYQNLDVLNNYIKVATDVEAAFAFGTYNVMRRLIIKKICKDASYAEFYSHWIERIEKANIEHNNEYLKSYNALIELESILKNW